MLRYSGTFNVVCRKRVDGNLSRVAIGTIHANSRKEAKRESLKLFGIDCDYGVPVVTFVKPDGWRDQFKRIFRRGSHSEKAQPMSAIEKERRDMMKSRINVGVRKDISSTDRTKRRNKGKQARQSRKANR